MYSACKTSNLLTRLQFLSATSSSPTLNSVFQSARNTRTLTNLSLETLNMHPRTKKPRLAGPGQTTNGAVKPIHETPQKTTVAPFRLPRTTPAVGIVKPEVITESSRHFSERKFRDAPISAESKAGIEHTFMSDVQAATLDLALSGKDLLVQAKTGTGKTLAFLLPSVERLLKTPPRRGEGISILVLSPTRELALQIEEEANTLLAHHPSFTVQHAIGGTNINSEKNRLTKIPPTLLIATPGRLLDHLQTGSLAADHFANVRTVVYDEADRLLDQGFKRELDGILGYLPKRGGGKERQALLFSATVSEEIKQVARSALRPDYTFVSTLLKDEINTHEHVDQSFIITPFSSFLPTALSLLLSPSNTKSPLKAILFFPTARHVSFAAALLEHIPGLPQVFEIHSRKSQSARGKAADGFKNAETGILICSDVVARGMDFPNVTLVMQLGLPSDSDQYIHRLGRTARAGAGGKGLLILSPAERFFLSSKTIRDLPIAPHVMPPSPPATSIDALSQAISANFAKVPREVKAAAYMSFMGYYNAHTKALGWTKEQLVEEAWRYAQGCLGWTGGDPPEMEARTVGKMGLRGVRGLNIGAYRGGRGGGHGGGPGAGRGARSEGDSARPARHGDGPGAGRGARSEGDGARPAHHGDSGAHRRGGSWRGGRGRAGRDIPSSLKMGDT